MNKFFASQIKGETRFGDGKIGMRQRQARRQNRITTVGNIRKGPTVHESRHTFHRLHEIRPERITQDSEERTRTILTARQPNSYKAVAFAVEDDLHDMAVYAITAINAVAVTDLTNQHANADVILPDGTILLHDVPVSHLLWLGGTYLPEMRKTIMLLPTLDPARKWNPREGGVHETDVVIQGSFVKDYVPLILHPGTDKHPPQVEKIERQVHVGEYANTALSGAVPASRKKDLLDRFDIVITAIKDAVARN